MALILAHVPLPLSSLFLRFLASFRESLQVVSSPCCSRQLPDVISESPSLDAGSSSPAVHRVLLPVSSTVSSAFPKQRVGRLPAFVLRTTSRRPVFRGCRYFVMFRPPSLLTPQIVPTAANTPQGSRGFYIRAHRALLPPHAPDMLTARIQAIDGTGTFTLPDFQPCRLLTSLQPHYRTFITTTGCSAPANRFGTFALAVGTACDFSLSIETKVRTFHASAWLRFAPPTCRMPLGPSHDIPRTDPGGRVNPRF